jgi:uncharacterized protein (DUF488 family)
MPELLTVGHGALRRAELAALLRDAGVEQLVDVRRFPASRSNPDVRREELEAWLPGAGVAYRWDERLGGRRHLPRGEPVPDSWWSVRAFAAYAAHTRTETFRDALAEVLTAVRGTRVAVMCSESVWWRCHRRLIADVAVLGHGVEVQHLFPTGRLVSHDPAAGARLDDDGLLRWDRAPR